MIVLNYLSFNIIHRHNMQVPMRSILAVVLWGLVAAQMDQEYSHYDDYAQAPDDSLYADFAARQQGRDV